MSLKTIFAVVLVTLASAALGKQWNVVASFDAAKSEDLSNAGRATPYTYSQVEIPVPALRADSNERKIIFGGKLMFAWSGAKPGAHYKIKAAFLSDSHDRQLRVETGGLPLAENLTLPRWKVLEQEWLVPADAVADGNVKLAISRISGANAVLSRMQVLSDSPQILSAPPSTAEMLAKIRLPMPRLSPRPAELSEVKTPLVSLDGTWRFDATPPAGFETFTATQTKSWNNIQVPGEWTMQGFTVKSNSAAAYWREFDVPADWRGQRVKLRFDTVHSDCRVFVNGSEVGKHEGGFTVFEFDITDAVKPGRNTLALAVKNESVADTLASATQYAAHQLGGITRKVQLFALPPVNLASQFVETRFDDKFENAVLFLKLSVADEAQGKLSKPVSARATLLDGNKTVAALTREISTGDTEISIPVAAPKKWDSEHPNLYRLKTELLVDGKLAETISQHVGFRQIEVRGNQLFVNGCPVKLRGACRHEVDPLRGRSLTPELWRKDTELFRAANVNYIRTSHYPPSEEFLDLCDKFGFFVECEAPLCWVQHGANPIWQQWDYQDEKYFSVMLRANLENLAVNRHHPCVTIWSLANESRWSPLFAEVNRRVKLADPTRPTSFHDQCWGDYNNARSQADIAVYHYPGENGPAKCDAENRPVLFGEFGHVECYNRRELVTDPGVRDDWGRGFARMCDLMYQHQGCLGGAIWAGIDDVFCLPNGKFVGYGMWGSICDGWRREKPEFWHVKKSYSSVRVTVKELPLPVAGAPIQVPIENRYNFANLSEVGIAWDIGGRGGKVHADIPARHSGRVLVQPRRSPTDGDVLHLVFTDPRGFVCEEENIVLGRPADDTVATRERPAGKLVVSQDAKQIQISGRDISYVIDRKAGQFTSGKVRGKTVLVGGPSLMVLPLQSEACEPVDLGVWKPLNNVCEDWIAESVVAKATADDAVEVTVKGTCKETTGTYVIRVGSSGLLQVRYDFVSRMKENPRQWGMVFFAPNDFTKLTWKREAQWTSYPADHIGRAEGTATALLAVAQKPYATQKPKVGWSQDATALGGNEFSSTKTKVYLASLASKDASLAVISDGHQSVRAFEDAERIGFLVAGFHTGGGDSFFNTHFATERKPLNPGSKIADTIRMQFTD